MFLLGAGLVAVNGGEGFVNTQNQWKIGDVDHGHHHQGVSLGLMMGLAVSEG